MNNASERLMIFIDNSNLFIGAQQIMGRDYRYDFGKLLGLLSNGRQIIQTHIYGSEIQPTPQELTNVWDTLKDVYNANVTITKRKTKKMVCFSCGHFWFKAIEKGVDVGLAIELLEQTYADSFDTAILVTGDADFIRAVERVQESGKKIEIVSIYDSISRDLIRITNYPPRLINENILEDIRY